MKMKQLFAALMILAIVVPGVSQNALASGQEVYKIAWSHYTGWEFWGYISDSGILDRHAARHGVEIKVELVNDYVESINLYTAGEYIGVTATNMDALTIPSVGGVDTTALIAGDTSDGNDGIALMGATSLCDIRGRTVRLVELSVSHYAMVRALEEKCGLQERDVKVMNTGDADIAAMFMADGPEAAVVTWNPPLMTVRNAPGATLVWDSSEIPGEIIDILFVRTDTPEPVKMALTGAWYELMEIMSAGGRNADQALEAMAQQAGGTLAEFKAQLRTTRMFFDPAEAAAFTESSDLKRTMDYVREFSFEHGLYGDADSADYVGIQFPDGSVVGNNQNVKLRFDSSYMKWAAGSRH